MLDLIKPLISQFRAWPTDTGKTVACMDALTKVRDRQRQRMGERDSKLENQIGKAIYGVVDREKFLKKLERGREGIGLVNFGNCISRLLQ